MSVVDECLSGTPYSLPRDGESEREVEKLWAGEHQVAQRLSRVREQLSQMNLRTETSNVQQAREIYESNAIEGVGPDLKETWEILQSESGQALGERLDERLMVDAITGDADVKAVLGLQGARLLVQRIREGMSSSRPITEADLRGLHGVICAGESHAGQYKRFHVQIGGENPHEPHLPIDVSAAMHELTSWFAGDASGSAILRAAAAHAWLTHIHPFEDGNGRLARLLANTALSQGGLPPAIVKHKSQRGAYLDALRHSDDGGDILPLAGLFLGTLQRYVREVDKPRFLRQVFRDEIARRGQSVFDWWRSVFGEFMELLNAELVLQRLTVEDLGELDVESFRFLHNLDSSGNAWLQFVRDPFDRELLLWFGYPSVEVRGHVDADLLAPSVYFSVRNSSRTITPFRRARPEEVGGFSEFTVVPDVPGRVYALRNGRLRHGKLADSASEIADGIGSAFRGGLIPKRPLTLF